MALMNGTCNSCGYIGLIYDSTYQCANCTRVVELGKNNIRKDRLEIEIRKQYKIYGYEKAHYLKDLLEEFFKTNFEIDGEK